jgi:hypothetical protein
VHVVMAVVVVMWRLVVLRPVDARIWAMSVVHAAGAQGSSAALPWWVQKHVEAQRERSGEGSVRVWLA